MSPIDICNSHCPERNQIDSRHELGNERWQKFPVPAKKINQHGSNTDIQYIINPGGIGKIPNALVAGIRFNLAF